MQVSLELLDLKVIALLDAEEKREAELHPDDHAEDPRPKRCPGSPGGVTEPRIPVTARQVELRQRLILLRSTRTPSLATCSPSIMKIGLRALGPLLIASLFGRRVPVRVFVDDERVGCHDCLAPVIRDR